MVRHLCPQLEPDGILVPQRITVDVALLDAAAETRRAMGEPLPPGARVPLGMVIDLTMATAKSGRLLPLTTVHIPDLDIERYWLAYLTRLEVFGEHLLNDYDSGITFPRVVEGVSPAAGESFRLRYEMSGHPGLVWERATM